MKRKVMVSLVLMLVLLSSTVGGQVRYEIQFPDIPGYKTLKCDLHMHTVFSDGSVWPTVRVEEAWRQGLDAISITDHIEYQPHKKDIPTQHNRPFEIAAGRARERNLLFPRGTEITRDTPPGHFNALFLKDVDPLETEDFLEVFKQAEKQKAFVFWNHQAWKGEEKGRWQEVHSTLYENKWLHGMEVCNGKGYHPTAHKWCLEKNLTMLGTSDIHDPDLRLRSTPEDHRTLTLVFVRERTLAALKEALMKGRTAVWFENQVIGREAYLEPLFQECVQLSPPHSRYKDTVWAKLTNRCDLNIKLDRRGGPGPREIVLPANSTTLLKTKVNTKAEQTTLSYSTDNYLVAPEKGLTVTFTISTP